MSFYKFSVVTSKFTGYNVSILHRCYLLTVLWRKIHHDYIIHHLIHPADIHCGQKQFLVLTFLLHQRCFLIDTAIHRIKY